MTTIFWAPKESEEYRLVRSAAVQGDTQRLTSALLNPSININALYGDGFEGFTVLHEAAAHGHGDVIQFLLDHGAPVDVYDKNHFGCSTPLIYAAQSAQVDAARILLDAGADIKVKGPNDGTVGSAVLPDAVRIDQNHLDFIILLLDRGFDVDARASSYGPSVLEQAIKAGSHTLIDILLDRGANFDNALGTAAEFHQNVDTVNFLIDKGASDTRSHALSRAACLNKMETAKALLARSSETKSDTRSTDALQQAARMGHLTMLDLLLDHGLDINSTDDLGQTPLGAASGADRPSCEVIQMLLRRGADVNAGTLKFPGSPYQAGDSPLHAAAWRSNPEIVELLLRACADLTSRNSQGETPLLKFARNINGHTIRLRSSNPRLDALRILLEAGSNLNARDVKGWTALHVLAADRSTDVEGNRLNATKLLLARGIDRFARNSEGKIAADLLQPKDTEIGQLLDSHMQGSGGK